MMNQSLINRAGYVFAGLCFFYILFLQFFRLGELPVVQWDESRLAVNAGEMYANGNFLVTTFGDKPDLYNTKPPLMIWLQVFSSFLFGLNEFALRFPSALAGMLSILLCALIVYKKTENLFWSGLTALMLATSGGFIQLHGSLTGDYDALLTLFILLSFYHHYRYIYRKGKNGLLYFTLFLSLAVFTKSAAALISFPVLMLLTLLRPNRKRFLSVVLACFLSLLPFLLYASIREIASEGYLSAIWNNDFLGRLSRALEGHTSEWYYYVVNLFTFRYSYIIWLLPAAIVYALFFRNRSLDYYSAAFLLYLIFLSCAQTRIHWYDMPLLPLATLVITFALYSLSQTSGKPALRYLLPLITLLLLIVPVTEKFNFIMNRKGLVLDRTHYELSEMLRNHREEKQVLYLAAPYDAEFYFYTLVNPDIRRGNFSTLRSNDIVMHGNLYRDSLNRRFVFLVLDSTANARKLLIQRAKE